LKSEIKLKYVMNGTNLIESASHLLKGCDGRNVYIQYFFFGN